MEWKRVLLRVMLFAFLGLLIEVFFTSMGGLLGKANFNLRGHSSLWMLPVYGLLGVLIVPVSEPLKICRIPLVVRAVIYMLLIFLVEYLFGVVFRWMGLRIWDYSNQPLNLHGHITLTYAPFWFWLGLWLEYLHKKLDACAVVMAGGYTAEALLKEQ